MSNIFKNSFGGTPSASALVAVVSPELDFTMAAATTIFTPDAGKSFMPFVLNIVIDTAVNATQNGAFNLGVFTATFDDWQRNGNLSAAFASVIPCWSTVPLNAPPSNTGPFSNSENPVVFNIVDGNQVVADSCTGRVFLIGMYV